MKGFNPRPDMMVIESTPSFEPQGRTEQMLTEAFRPQFEPKAVAVAFTADSFESGYTPEMFQATRLTPRQQVAMKALKCSLYGQHALLENGRHVETNGDALRWLLEQIAGQLPEELFKT